MNGHIAILCGEDPNYLYDNADMVDLIYHATQCSKDNAKPKDLLSCEGYRIGLGNVEWAQTFDGCCSIQLGKLVLDGGKFDSIIDEIKEAEELEGYVFNLMDYLQDEDQEDTCNDAKMNVLMMTMNDLLKTFL